MSNKKELKLGCGLYGPALLMKDDLWGAIQGMKDCGFCAIEPFVLLGNQRLEEVPSRRAKHCMWSVNNIKEMMPRLNETGLVISSAHVGFFDRTPLESTDDLIKISNETGIRYFIYSPMIDETGIEKAAFTADQLSKANKILNSHGITLLLHNHDMEFHELETEFGKISIMEYILKKSNPCVKIQIDTGWAMYGGGDILKFMNQYKDRIISVHFKDFCKGYETVERIDSFCSIGEGMLPTEEILKIVPELDLFPYGVMIDQDNPVKGGDLLYDLEKGVKFLNKHNSF